MMTKPVSYTALSATVGVGGMPATYYFVYPDRAGVPFYMGIPSIYKGGDKAVVQAAMGRLHRSAKRIRDVEWLPASARWYDITKALPPFMIARLGSRESSPGPNCYQAALASIGYDNLAGRHVSPEEASYYLTRDFAAVPVDQAVAGGIYIYSRRQSMAGVRAMVGGADERSAAGEGRFGLLSDVFAHIYIDGRPMHTDVTARRSLWEVPVVAFDQMRTYAQLHDKGISVRSMKARTTAEAFHPVPKPKAATAAPCDVRPVSVGEHAALILPAGMIFQKGNHGRHSVYRIVPADRAMSSIEMAKSDRFMPAPPPQERDESFVRNSYVHLKDRKKTSFPFHQGLSNKLASYLPVVRYYSSRMQTSISAGAGFISERMDLLSAENMWNILDDIETVLRFNSGGMSFVSGLLCVDARVAEEILLYYSLQCQYKEMIIEFASLPSGVTERKETQYKQEVYRDHYIHADSPTFREEIEVHLAMREVPREKWPAMVAYVVGKVKEHDPLTFIDRSRKRGLPFFAILDKAIIEY